MKKAILILILNFIFISQIKAITDEEMNNYLASRQTLETTIKAVCSSEKYDLYSVKYEGCLSMYNCNNYSSTECLNKQTNGESLACATECLYIQMQNCDYLLYDYIDQCQVDAANANVNNAATVDLKNMRPSLNDELKKIVLEDNNKCSDNSSFTLQILKTPTRKQTYQDVNQVPTLIAKAGDTVIMPEGRWEVFLEQERYLLSLRGNTNFVLPCRENELGKLSKGIAIIVVPAVANNQDIFSVSANKTLLKIKNGQLMINANEQGDQIYFFKGEAKIKSTTREDAKETVIKVGQWADAKQDGVLMKGTMQAREFVKQYPDVINEELPLTYRDENISALSMKEPEVKLDSQTTTVYKNYSLFIALGIGLILIIGLLTSYIYKKFKNKQEQ